MGPSSDTDHTPKLYRSKETPLRLRSLLQPRDMSYSPRHRCLGRPLAYLIKSLIQNWWENRRTTTALCGDTRVSYPIAFSSSLFFFLLFCPTNAYGMSVWVTKVNLQWSLPAEGPHFPCLCFRFSFLPELRLMLLPVEKLRASNARLVPVPNSQHRCSLWGGQSPPKAQVIPAARPPHSISPCT